MKKLGEELLSDNVIDSALISLSSKTTVGGLFTSTYGWITQTRSTVFIGILITILGFLVNYYFQKKKAKRDLMLWEQNSEANIISEQRNLINGSAFTTTCKLESRGFV